MEKRKEVKWNKKMRLNMKLMMKEVVRQEENKQK
jgi:hypothetical protein